MISFERYLNEDKLSNKDIIFIKCKKCGKEDNLEYKKIKTRKNFGDKEWCHDCCVKYANKKRFNVPEELWDYDINNPVPYKLFLKFKDTYSNQYLNVEIKCKICNKVKIVKWKSLVGRKYTNDAICNDCIVQYTMNNFEYRNKQKEIQTIIQNKKDVIEKNRNSQLIRYKNNPDIKKIMGKKCSEKLKGVKKSKESIEKMKQTKIKTKQIRSEISKNLWKDTNYSIKITGNKKSLKGYYNNIRFDSSYELSYVIYYINHIKRCNLYIPYKYNNKTKLYFPDYILNIDDKKYLIEIKGYNSEIVQIKKEAGIEYAKNNNFNGYKLLFKEDLLKLDNFIMYDNKDKIDTLDITKLKITNIPKGWK